jgi:2-phospho-L-lactate/phosphoenolpyruvate guanylyltransferase
MAGVVVPFRGPDGKRRLDIGSEEARAALAHAMLADVVEACSAVGRTIVVTSDAAVPSLDAEVLADPGRGQGAAVAAGLERLPDGPALVVNADLPCVLPRDLFALVGATPPGGIALVAAADGTTNALGLASPGLFEPLYGPGSADRFRRDADERGVPCAFAEIPNLAADVDTIDDAERLSARAGPSTQEALASLRIGVGR